MRPRPTIAMRGNTGSEEEVIPEPKTQNPKPKGDLDPGIWDLPGPAPARDRLQTDAAADCGRDDAQLRHQAIELRGEHRLRAVAQRPVGIVVHFDDETIRAHG